MANSIYDIPVHESTDPYSKNAIVMVKSDIGDSEIAKTLKYYYALKDMDGGSPGIPITNAAYWGGYTTINKQTEIPYFLWIPSYNVSTNHAPKVNSIVFGNGYQQRSPDGIYTGLIKMEMSFDMRGDAEAKAILHFLRVRKGVSSFVVKNLPEIYGDSGYKKRFICQNFNSNFSFYDNHTVKVSFVETNN